MVAVALHRWLRCPASTSKAWNYAALWRTSHFLIFRGAGEKSGMLYSNSPNPRGGGGLEWWSFGVMGHGGIFDLRFPICDWGGEADTAWRPEIPRAATGAFVAGRADTAV